MKGEWKDAFEPWSVDDGGEITDQLIRWAIEIKECPGCRALVQPSGTLTHELVCPA